MTKTFYIATAIDYVNAEPHIGHAYQKIIADALARWHKLLGEEVFFLTGTDEHGKKVAESAQKAGKSPKEFVDEISQKFKESWKLININYDRFIRTTDSDHKEIVKKFAEIVNKSKDIYKGEYQGYYCTGCETFYTETECPDLICKFHKRPLEKLKEETYFFKLSKYQDFLLEHYKRHPEFILPEQRRKEVINRVKEGLKDLSITRTSVDWGIPFPLEKNHVFYVWFEALINYYTATQSSQKLIKFWPTNLNLLGIDNMWFHTVIWPAMLKSAGIALPITVFNHGFLTFNGQKISKSLGNAISIKMLVERYGSESIRYFVCRNFVFGEDGDFDEKALAERHNNELANKLGNLVSRVSTLAEKYGIEKTDPSLKAKELLKKVKEHFEKYELHKALDEIFAYIDKTNEYIQNQKPWEVRSPQREAPQQSEEAHSKSESNSRKVLYELVFAIRNAAILLSPFIPETSEKIAQTFSFKISLKELDKPLKISSIKKSEILFKKIQ